MDTDRGRRVVRDEMSKRTVVYSDFVLMLNVVHFRFVRARWSEYAMTWMLNYVRMVCAGSGKEDEEKVIQATSSK